MKKFLLAAGSLIALGMSSNAMAATTTSNGNWYAGLSGDLTWLNHSDVGGGGNISLGYRFIPSSFGAFRLEAEGGYHSADGDTGYSNTHYFTYMGNAYYDFLSIFPGSSNSWQIVPYVGAGIGGAAVHFGNNNSAFATTFKHHDNVLAYQGMAGLSFVAPGMPNTDWSLGYRYLGTAETGGTHLHANNVELGVRFHF